MWYMTWHVSSSMWGQLPMQPKDGQLQRVQSRGRRPTLGCTTTTSHVQLTRYQESGEFSHLTWTLVDHIDTSEEKLEEVGHTGGAKCRCSECQRLKDQEDKWICRLGSFEQPAGLNARDEIQTRVRVNFRDRAA